jgi:succinate dehydrogenase / fumarate reductase flavoprotein subunit
MVAGPAIATYRKNLARSSWDLPRSLFERAEKRDEDAYMAIVKREGPENPYVIHEELGQRMLEDCTVERDNVRLDALLARIGEFSERAGNAKTPDTSGRANQGAQFVRHLGNMLALARVVVEGARRREESRGAHFKPTARERDDARWLRTTLAFSKADGGVDFVRAIDHSICGKSLHATDEVDTSLVKPRPRVYGRAALTG